MVTGTYISKADESSSYYEFDPERGCLVVKCVIEDGSVELRVVNTASVAFVHTVSGGSIAVGNGSIFAALKPLRGILRGVLDLFVPLRALTNFI